MSLSTTEAFSNCSHSSTKPSEILITHLHTYVIDFMWILARKEGEKTENKLYLTTLPYMVQDDLRCLLCLCQTSRVQVYLAPYLPKAGRLMPDLTVLQVRKVGGGFAEHRTSSVSLCIPPTLARGS